MKGKGKDFDPKRKTPQVKKTGECYASRSMFHVPRSMLHVDWYCYSHELLWLMDESEDDYPKMPAIY